MVKMKEVRDFDDSCTTKGEIEEALKSNLANYIGVIQAWLTKRNTRQ